MDLRDYERTKFELADIVRAALALADKPLQERLQPLFVRIAEDRFNLVVAGRFSRGKSSLMNAILRTDRLPTGIVPLTSVITTVAYGSTEEARIRYRGSRLASEVPLGDLPAYVTQQGNPGNARGVEAAEVKLPAEILRRGFHFVDTPGLGSPVEANSRTTEEFLPEADALVLVTSYDGPLSEEELRVTRAACATGRRVFVALNKHDLVPQEARDEALRYARTVLERELGERAPAVFSVSAREAIEAARAGDAQRLAASGVPRLEGELTRFLLAEKSAQMVLHLCARLAEHLRAIPPSDARQSLSTRLADLMAQLPQGRGGVSEARTHPGLHAPRGCEICGHLVQVSFDFLAQFQYRLSASAAEQQANARQGGLCAAHTWQYASLASLHSLCTGYPALVERWAERLRALAASGGGPEALAADVGTALPRGERCALCRACAEAEGAAVRQLAARLEREESALASLSLICLPHLSRLLAATGKDDVARALASREAAMLERLAEDMRRYAIKHDAVRRFLASDEELAAGRSALAALAGHRNVNTFAEWD
jgi:GTP-binding protein EngB required for normal cell division